MQTRHPIRALVLALVCSSPATGQLVRDIDLGYVRAALELGAAGLPEVEATWRARLAGRGGRDESFEQLFGYDPPGHALRLAWLSSFLFSVQEDEADALRAAAWLRRMADYRAEVPQGLRDERAEYADGLPAVPSFFHLADYAEAWSRVATCAAIDAETRAVVELAIVESADFVFLFPEWGAHNRAMLRAESLAWCARALPDHSHAADWTRMARVLADDSRGQWEIEDAAGYQPIWLLALFRYAQASGDRRVVETPAVHLALRNLMTLLTPRGTLPAYGDAWFDGGLSRLCLCFERGADLFQDAELSWAAHRVWQAMGVMDPAAPDLGRADMRARLWHLGTPLYPRRPADLPQVEQLVGKKVVFRSGWGPEDFYLCLNYKDEGDDALVQRDYLRQNLAVVEEKMHHGHEDENSIVLMMDGGSVLLHDAGYRAVAPSGPHGAWRADHFHNRVVVRDREGQLLDDGAYDPVRTRTVDRVDLEGAVYTRTRVDVTNMFDGYTWDRILVHPKGWRLVVVVDVVQPRTPYFHEFTQLWGAQEVREVGPGFARTRTTSIAGRGLPVGRELLLAFPGLEEVPLQTPLERHGQPEVMLSRSVSNKWDWGPFTMPVVLASIPASEDGAAHAARFERLEVEGPGLGLTLKRGEETLALLLKVDLDHGVTREDVRPRYAFERCRVSTDHLTSDGDLTLLWEGPGESRWEAVNVTRVDVRGSTVFEARPLQLFQTSGRSDVAAPVEWRRWGGRIERR